MTQAWGDRSCLPVPPSTDFVQKPQHRHTLDPSASNGLNSQVLTMISVTFSLSQGVLLYEEKFENNKSIDAFELDQQTHTLMTYRKVTPRTPTQRFPVST